nr:protein arginine n-methyltransferase sfm1 [Quercus suber]
MAEEVEKSSVNVARAMVYSVLINGALGFAMLLSILFSVDDIQALAQSKATYPIIDILASSFDSKGGATAIIGLIVFMNFAATIGALSSSGRMMWSFARDRGLPGWQWLKRVDGSSSIPVNTILVTATAAVLLGLVNLGSTTAFQIFLSVVLEGFYGSYLAATSLLLYRRVRGDIDDFHEDPYMESPTREASVSSRDKRRREGRCADDELQLPDFGFRHAWQHSVSLKGRQSSFCSTSSGVIRHMLAPMYDSLKLSRVKLEYLITVIHDSTANLIIQVLSLLWQNMDVTATKQYTFIVEHLDPELEAWQKLEYNTINQECSRSNSKFLLTGLVNPSILNDDAALTVPSSQLLAESVETLYSDPEKKRRVCLLDPKGEKDICPADGHDFDVFLFGGILGDHPPRDRTAELRNLGFTGRRLGPEQMTTDTAARVTRIVVQEGSGFNQQFSSLMKRPLIQGGSTETLDQIPFVYKPVISSSTDGSSNETVEMPFKYILDASGKPVMPKGMLELLASDADKDILDLL